MHIPSEFDQGLQWFCGCLEMAAFVIHQASVVA